MDHPTRLVTDHAYKADDDRCAYCTSPAGKHQWHEATGRGGVPRIQPYWEVES